MIASRGYDNKIYIYSIENNSLLSSLSGGDEFFYDFVFNPNGETIVTASKQKDIKFWNIATGVMENSIPTPATDLDKIAFSNCHRYMIFGGKNHIIVYDNKEGKIAKQLTCPTPIADLSFSGDNKKLASLHLGKLMRIWDLSDY